MPRPFLLAAALRDPDPVPDPGRLLALARTAEDAGLDLVTIEPGPADALLVAARLAAQTTRIGIVPVVGTTTTEPFHVSTALATIDVVADGRAGWVLYADEPGAVRETVTWDVPGDAAGDAAEHLDAVRALWDSWEEGAVIRDVATDRFLDRDRVHHVDLRGEHLSVRGPSITPRPPQGHPPVLLRATDDATRALALRQADVLVSADPALLRGPSAGDLADGAADAAGDAGHRGPAVGPGGPLRVLELLAGPHADLAERVLAAHTDGHDGVLLHADDLAGALAVLVPALAAAGVRPGAASPGVPSVSDDLGAVPGQGHGAPAPSTLRERLGLAPAVNRFGVPA